MTHHHHSLFQLAKIHFDWQEPFYDELSSEDADQLGLYLIEGDTPGSSFAGVQVQTKPQELNRELQKLGINMQVE